MADHPTSGPTAGSDGPPNPPAVQNGTPPSNPESWPAPDRPNIQPLLRRKNPFELIGVAAAAVTATIDDVETPTTNTLANVLSLAQVHPADIEQVLIHCIGLMSVSLRRLEQTVPGFWARSCLHLAQAELAV